MKSYRQILAVPGALSIFLSVLIVRATTIAADFALFWLLAKDSLAFAALGLGAIYLGIALGNPLFGKLADHLGVKRTLSASALLFLLLATGLFLLPLSAPGLLALAFLLGFTRPAAQGFARASWQILYQSQADRLRAASLDSIQSALINGLAGAIAVFLAQVIDPGFLLFLFALLASATTLYLAQSKIAKALIAKQRAEQEKDGERKHSSLLLGSFYKLLLVQILFFLTDGFLVVALLFFAASLGVDALGGVLILVFLLGALLGAYRYGRRAGLHLNHTREIQKILPRYTTALLLLPLALWQPLLLLPSLFLAGMARSGFTPSAQTYLQEIVPLPRLNEAIAWMYVALVVGSGLGRVLLGPLEELALFVPACLALLAALAALLLSR